MTTSSVHLDTPVASVADQHVQSRDDRELVAKYAVVVATDPTSAAGLITSVAAPRMNPVTTVYFATDAAPTSEPILLLDGTADPGTPAVLNAVTLSQASPEYAPPGRHLVSVSVLGASHGPGLADRLKSRLAVLFDVDTSEWQHLADYPIAEALPHRPPPLVLRSPVRTPEGVYVCGDHRDTSSIQGAMVSGRRAAAAVLADLPGRVRIGA